MSEKMQVLAELLLNKPTVQESDIADIKALVSKYPYFAPAQFLLLEKLKQTEAADFKEQQQKAILYFPDPVEFEFWFNTESFTTTIAKKTEAATIEERLTEEEPYEINEQTDEEPEAEIKALNEETNEDLPIALGKTLDTPVPEQQLSFEPYHTVDYFASQGIKIVEEEAPKDNFGKQLKSFTEWLRTMKRLPATAAPATMDSQVEKSVQNLAASSVNDTDVYTEAMAEIWEKQGNRQKAIEVYNKLCLLNPSKKAYFATKIEYLKGS